MPRYHNRPIILEAFRIGPRGEPTPAPAWFGSPSPDHVTDEGILIETNGGLKLARWGWYVIRGVHGEFYPCKPEIFEATYDLDEG